MGRVSNRRVEMEMTLVRLCSPELDQSQAAILRRLEALERQLRQVSPAAPVSSGLEERKPGAPAPGEAQRAAVPPPKAEVPEPVPLPEEPSEPEPDLPPAAGRQETAKAPVQKEKAPPVSAQEKPVRLAEWPEVLQLLSGESRTVASAFHGSGAYIRGDYVLIAAKNDLAFELLRRSDYRNKMRDAIRQVTGRVYKLGPYKEKQEQEESQDPLKALEEKAQAAGIEVVRKT